MIESKFKQIQSKLMNYKCGLVAVSKGQPEAKLKAAYQLGQRVFGENYLQEFLSKKENLNLGDFSWHFIGRIQTKKIKDLVGECDLIHSVATEKHLLEINKRSESKSIVQNILLQINLVDEDSKAGFDPKRVKEILNLNLDNINIRGFMFMPPMYESKQDYESFYKKVNEFHKSIQVQFSNLDLSELSMGTSGDYDVALEFGATWIRLGRTLFGEREN